LGALILGVLISNHPKAKALAKSLFSFKELMLVGLLSVSGDARPTKSADHSHRGGIGRAAAI
jgi:predicted Kef-type K+ transport protein